MKLDERILYDFVQQARDALALENKSILAMHGSSESFAWNYMIKPDEMDWWEFGIYSWAVGAELVAQKVLKIDKWKKRGLTGHNPLRLRLSKKWYNENRKKEEAK